MALFKKAVVVDRFAGFINEAVSEDIAVFDKALREVAKENYQYFDFESIFNDVWTIELILLEAIFSTKSISREVSDNCLAMLAVGYARFDTKQYVDLTERYRSTIRGKPADKIYLAIATEFIKNKGIVFKNERNGVTVIDLRIAIIEVVKGSFKGLEYFVSSLLKDYKVVL